MLKKMERRWIQISLDQVKQFGREWNTETVWHDALQHEMLETSDKLAKKKNLKIDFEDGTVWTYEFLDERHLKWEVSDGRKGEEIYNACTAPGYDEVLCLHHYCSLEIPGCVDMYIDLENGWATVVDAHLGHPEDPREVWRQVLFGKIEGMEQNEAKKPCFTDDLTGKAIRWRHPGTTSEGIKYIFSSCNYYTYAMKTPAKGVCWMATNPAEYVKIQDNLYLCAVVEQRQTGVQLCMLMNLETLTDVQSEFGLGGSTDEKEKLPWLETFQRKGREGIMDSMATDMFNY